MKVEGIIKQELKDAVGGGRAEVQWDTQYPVNARTHLTLEKLHQLLIDNLPEKADSNKYFEAPPPGKVEDGSELHHAMHQPSAREGYNQAIDEMKQAIDKLFNREK